MGSQQRKKAAIYRNRRFTLLFVICVMIALLVLFAQNGRDTEPVSGKPTVLPTANTNQPSFDPSSTHKPSIGFVVIDPGHGGHDKGALGSPGMKNEDELNLAIALKVGTYLSELGITPIYTRTTNDAVLDLEDNDQMKELQARVDIINSSHAFLAVSIHMNSFSGDGAQWTDGPEVYYYDGNDSSSESEIWAEAMQSVLNEACEDDRSHKAGDLMVLRETKIPAILIECGFLSSLSEEQKLNNVAYQEKIAKAIANCIYQNAI